MSGPVTTQDAAPVGSGAPPEPCDVELTASREAQVGAFRVRRALPRRGRRTVGAWCFVDHMGPATVTEREGVDVGPHPHTGLQTVTWLLDGEVLHRDSLGSEQVIRPGQLNLMTAGHGVAHAEERTGTYRGPLHGVQLWVAQPDHARHGAAAFDHHAELPRAEVDTGAATVLVGSFGDVTSPARRDTDHVGVDLDLRRGTSVLPLRRDHEHALVVLAGELTVERCDLAPGRLAYLGIGRDEVTLTGSAPARALLIGGAPFESPIVMWWNYVARTRAEISDAHRAWTAGTDRFGPVASSLARLASEPPPWDAR